MHGHFSALAAAATRVKRLLSRSHGNEQIAWVLKGEMDFRLGSETAALQAGRRHRQSRRYGARGMVSRRHRSDRFLCASARGLSTRRQTRLHERGLNSPLRLLSPPGRQTGRTFNLLRGAPRCERGSSLESKHRCRLGGDCANLFRGDLEPIFGSNVHWRKVGDGAQNPKV